MKKYRAWREPGHRPLHPGGKYVFGYATLMWLRRRAKRLGHKITWRAVSGPRDRMKAAMRWTLAHEPQIHYLQRRPFDPSAIKNRKLPMWDDCSATTTQLFKAAGFKDPNRRNYDGYGYTGTLRRQDNLISLSAARVGDYIIYGRGTGDHVVVVYERGPDPIVWSHGQESGPRLYKHSAQNAYHGGHFTVHSAL